MSGDDLFKLDGMKDWRCRKSMDGVDPGDWYSGRLMVVVLKSVEFNVNIFRYACGCICPGDSVCGY